MSLAKSETPETVIEVDEWSRSTTADVQTRAGAASVRVALVALMGLLAGCSTSRPCRDNTAFVTMSLGALAQKATSLELSAAFDEGLPSNVPLKNPQGPLHSVESKTIDFPTGTHPKKVKVKAVVRSSGGQELGSDEQTGDVTGSCLVLSLSLDRADGGSADTGGDSHRDGAAIGGGSGFGGAGGRGAGAGGGAAAAGGSAGRAAGGAWGGARAGGSGGGTSTGGTAAGGMGTGGTNTGGVAAGGSSTGGQGTGGAACQASEARCSGVDLQTCQAGQWGAPVTCGANRSCTGPAGTAKCTCKVDPLCAAVGSTCSGTTQAISCMQDANLCIYAASSIPCTSGACSGGVCCTNQCTEGVSICAGDGYQSCVRGTNGCTTTVQTSCQASYVCERYQGPLCADVNWAEWPAPNTLPDTNVPNVANFSDNQNGTINDNVTKLIWQKDVAPGTYAWASAISYCQGLVLGDSPDWRLPSEIELLSIVDHEVRKPAINPTYFPGTPPGSTDEPSNFWSATPRVRQDGLAWYVDFRDGLTISTKGEEDELDFASFRQTNNYYVRCVR